MTISQYAVAGIIVHYAQTNGYVAHVLMASLLFTLVGLAMGASPGGLTTVENPAINRIMQRVAADPIGAISFAFTTLHGPIAYVLSMALVAESSGGDKVEASLDAFGSALAMHMLEIVIMRCGLYAIGMNPSRVVTWWDINKAATIKYVYVASVIVIGLTFSPGLVGAMLFIAVYTGDRTIDHLSAKIPSPEGETAKKRYHYYLAMCGMLQWVSVLYLTYTRQMGWGFHSWRV